VGGQRIKVRLWYGGGYICDMDMDMSSIKFWHKVQLKDGSYTNGLSDVANHGWYQFDAIDFVGKSVLDIGCWDGYFSFEAERRGASRVTSLDDCDYRWGGMDGYWYLHDHFGSKAEFVKGSVYDLTDIFNNQRFDIVLCYGVLYHLSDPYRAMINVYDVCEQTAVFEGLYEVSTNKYLSLLDVGYCNDPSNFYKISTAYAEYISKLSGFEVCDWKHYNDRSSYVAKRTDNKCNNIYDMKCKYR